MNNFIIYIFYFLLKLYKVIYMTKKITMEYIGKERVFTNNSAFINNKNLEDMGIKLQEKTNDPNVEIEDIFMIMGEYVATIFENFDPKEFLEADDLDVYLVKGLNTLKNMYKMGSTNKEIEKAKKEIIDNAIKEELFRLQ